MSCKKLKKEHKTRESIPIYYQNVTSTVSEECAAKMPKITSVAREIQQEKQFGVVPKTVGDIEIPMELQITFMRGKFLRSCLGAEGFRPTSYVHTEANFDILER